MAQRATAPRGGAPGRVPGSDDPPAGLTLLTGSEEFLVSRAIAGVLAGARAADPDTGRQDIDLADPDDPEAIGRLQAATSPSLFGESTVVVVHGVAKATDRALDVLVGALAGLPEQTWVVAHHAGATGKRVERLRGLVVDRGVVTIDCTAPKRGASTRRLLVDEARAAGRRLTSDGADALVRALGSDLSVVAGGLRQLLADWPHDPIDAVAVTETFAGVAEVRGFQMADAVWGGEGRQALRTLRLGQATQTVNSVGAVAAMAAVLRSMVRASGPTAGMSDQELARRIGAYPGKVPALRAWARSWDRAALADALVALADLDADVKGGLRPSESLDPAQKEHALEAFLLRASGLAERSG